MRAGRSIALVAAVLGIAVLVVAGLAWMAPAAAAGGQLSPVAESYEPGDVATMVGYTGGPGLVTTPTVPFYAYLRPAAGTADLQPLDTGLPLGRLVVQQTAHRGFLALRVSITFEVPMELEGGEYVVWFCDDPCTRAPIGDLVASPLAIGVEPARPVARAWAFDDPEIANLAPEALVVGADFQATAADVRAGRVAPPPEPAPTVPPPTVPSTVPVPVTPGTTPATEPASPLDPPARNTMDGTLPTALMAAAAVGTWALLSRRERSCAPELARSPRVAPGAGRNAAAGGG